MVVMDLRIHLVSGRGRITHPRLPGLFAFDLDTWKLTRKARSRWLDNH